MEGQQHLVNLAHTTPSFPTAHLVWGTGGARDAPGTGGPRLEQAAWPLGSGGHWRSSGRQASPRDERRSRCLGVRRQDSCGIKATPKESRRYWAKAVYFFSLKPIRKGDRQSVSRSVSQPLPQATASQPASPSLRVTGFLQGLARPRRGWCPLSGTGRSPTARASLRGPVRPAAASPRPLPGPPAPARGTDRPRSLPRAAAPPRGGRGRGHGRGAGPPHRPARIGRGRGPSGACAVRSGEWWRVGGAVVEAGGRRPGTPPPRPGPLLGAGAPGRTRALRVLRRRLQRRSVSCRCLRSRGAGGEALPGRGVARRPGFPPRDAPSPPSAAPAVRAQGPEGRLRGAVTAFVVNPGEVRPALGRAGE